MQRSEQPSLWATEAASALHGAGDPCSRSHFTARETGWGSGSAVGCLVFRDVFSLGNQAENKFEAREPRAVRLSSFASGDRSNGGGFMAQAVAPEVGLLSWATEAANRNRGAGDPRSDVGEMTRATAGSSRRHGYRGPCMEPVSSFGKLNGEVSFADRETEDAKTDIVKATLRWTG